MEESCQHPKPKDVRTGGIARAPKELQPWEKDRPSERQPRRAVAIPRYIASRQGEAGEAAQPLSPTAHPSHSGTFQWPSLGSSQEHQQPLEVPSWGAD